MRGVGRRLGEYCVLYGKFYILKKKKYRILFVFFISVVKFVKKEYWVWDLKFMFG